MLIASKRSSIGGRQQKLLHIPGTRRATFSTQAAVQTHILVFHHHTTRFQIGRHVKVLCELKGRSAQTRSEVLLFTVLCKGDAIRWADVSTGIAFDTSLGIKDCLYVAVQAAAGFFEGSCRVKAALNFNNNPILDVNVNPNSLQVLIDYAECREALDDEEAAEIIQILLAIHKCNWILFRHK